MNAVLIIDDDLGTLATFREVLRLEGFDVCTAESGRAGLQLLEQRSFDLAVVDVRLPDLDGVTLLRAARAAHISVPFVFVTGFGTVASAVEAMQLGARHYVEKPLVGEELVHVVKSSMRTPANPEAHALPLPISPVEEPHVARTLQLIEECYHDAGLSARSLAAKVGISAAHLCRLMKQHTRKSLGRHLHATRIRHVQRLLRDTMLTPQEIANQVGYQRTSQLDRYFRRLCGLTPSEYRRTIAARTSPQRAHQK